MAKTGSKSFSLSNFSQKLPSFRFLLLYKYKIKNKKMVKFIDPELDLNDSDDSNDSNYSNSE